MMAALQLSLELPVYGTSFDRLRELAYAAEAAGLSGVWVPDHVVPGWPGAPPPMECWTTLSAVAGTTSRITLGPLVLALTLRNPPLIAEQARTLAELCGGRLILGLGLGGFTYKSAAGMLDLGPRSVRDRVKQLGSGIDLMRGRWKAAGARQVPIWLAGRSREVLDLTARVADGWSCPFVAEFERRQHELDVACDAIGRPRTEIRRSAYAVAALGATITQAERVLGEAGAMGTMFGDIRRDHVFGPPSQAVERLSRLARAGAAEVTLHIVGRHETRLSAIELLRTAVVPELASL